MNLNDRNRPDFRFGKRSGGESEGANPGDPESAFVTDGVAFIARCPRLSPVFDR